MNIISAHGVGTNNKLFIWSSDETQLSFYHLCKANEHILQFKKVNWFFGNHSKISLQSLPKFILCAAENNDILLFAKSNTDRQQGSDVKYERCNNDWFDTIEAMENETVADAAVITCRIYETEKCCDPSIMLHTWFYHSDTMVFYVLKHASNNALIYNHYNLCPFTAAKLNAQILKIEEALNIKMTLPQFLLKVDGDGDVVSKFELILCDKYEIVYEKRKESEESKHDHGMDTCVNALLNFQYGLPQT